MMNTEIMMDLLKTPRYPKIYKNVGFSTSGNITERHIVFETIVRKKAPDGKWYITLFRRTYCHDNVPYENKAFVTMDTFGLLNNFNSEIYFFLIKAIVGDFPDLKDIYGNKIFELDPDQREEEERLND